MRFAAQPWLWVVPVLPVLWLGLRLWDREGRRRMRSLLGDRAAAHVEGRHASLLGWDRFLLLAGLFWLLIALARPQWGASEVTVTQRGSDVVVVLDISNSMRAEDVAPSRLERAKTELGSFLQRVQDSRIGLVFFAGAAFVQCPLTLDYGTADMFLKMADADMLSEQGTNIGAALSTARQLLAKGRQGGSAAEGFQAIILVTDGEDLEGDWQKEADACQKEGIRVIPVGVGSAEGGLIPAFDRQGRPAGFMKDEEGNVVTTHLNLEALDKLGALGGVGSFRLGVDGLAGDRLYRELQRLGRRDLEDRRVSAYKERFVWPLMLAIGCFALRLGLRPWRRHALRVVALIACLAVLPSASRAAGLVRDGATAAAEGRRLYEKGDFQGALSAFQGAVVQAPDDPLLSLAVGESLFRLQKYPEALREFDRALSLTDDPSLRAEAHYNRGTTALAAGDVEGAIKSLRESLKLDPDQQNATFNLEAALRRQQQEKQQQNEPKQDKNKQDKQEQQKQEQQKQEQQKQEQQKQEQQKQDRQEQKDQQEQQEQQQDKQQQDQNQQDQQQEQQSKDEQGPPKPEEQQPQAGAKRDGAQPELTDEQAAQILKALDRDEEELKRSLQKRVQGKRPRSGKRW